MPDLDHKEPQMWTMTWTDRSLDLSHLAKKPDQNLFMTFLVIQQTEKQVKTEPSSFCGGNDHYAEYLV